MTISTHVSRILFVVALLLPATALAQKGVERGFEEKCHSQTFKSTQHCHVVPEGSEPLWVPGDTGTITAQALGGLLGAAVFGAGAGFGVLYATGGDLQGSCPECAGAAVIVGVFAMFPGMAVGVWGAGDLMGGNGSFLWTLAGTVGFGCLGAIGAYYLSADLVFEDELRSYDRMSRSRSLGAAPPKSGRGPVLAVPLVNVKF